MREMMNWEADRYRGPNVFQSHKTTVYYYINFAKLAKNNKWRAICLSLKANFNLINDTTTVKVKPVTIFKYSVCLLADITVALLLQFEQELTDH